eukprot:m.82491 g.82491  ORF g.82491 m.82491 type:complete len:50 (+) comp50780_c1_seq1:332-481(+)
MNLFIFPADRQQVWPTDLGGLMIQFAMATMLRGDSVSKFSGIRVTEHEH